MDNILNFVHDLMYGKTMTYHSSQVVPKIIPTRYRKLFSDQARLAGITPAQYGEIVKREQGPRTKFKNIHLTGVADPRDKGLMQVNAINEPMVRQQFIQNLGRKYNPNSIPDSIIAGSLVLQNNRKQFNTYRANQKKINKSFKYSTNDLLDSYNAGVYGIIKSRMGNKQSINRINRYQQAGVADAIYK